MSAVLQVKDLRVRYPNAEQDALNLPSLTIGRGELVLVHGRSGCGKSTLFRVLNGLTPHLVEARVRGEVTLFGEELLGRRPEELSTRVGSIFQNYESQIVQTTLADEMAFGLENRNLAAPRIRDLLASSAFLRRWGPSTSIDRVSGGTRQKLVLESVLAMEPELILLDEPLSNLDLDSAHALLGRLRRLCDDGRSVLLIEHRTDLARTYADRSINLGAYREGMVPGPLEDAPAGKELLSVRGLTFGYAPETPVFEGVDLSLAEGTANVLYGDNGSGKTTLFRLLSGLLRPQSGTIELAGQPLRSLSRKKRNGLLGYVFQNPNNQLFMRSVAEEINLGAVDVRTQDEVIELCGLEPLLARHPFSLSEGQKRLVALCAIVVSRPKLLLLDEPTIGQDDESLSRMMGLLAHITRRWGTCLFSVTHDPRVARGLGGAVYRLEKGRVMQRESERT